MEKLSCSPCSHAQIYSDFRYFPNDSQKVFVLMLTSSSSTLIGQKAEIPPPIPFFRGYYFFLSNFSPTPEMKFLSLPCPTLEHAYQASKALTEEDQLWVLSSSSPGVAKRRGRSIPLWPGWEELKIPLMRKLLTEKFSSSSLRERLLETSPRELVEGNSWGDTFWGVSNGKGENHLGKLLMELRAEILTK